MIRCPLAIAVCAPAIAIAQGEPKERLVFQGDLLSRSQRVLAALIVVVSTLSCANSQDWSPGDAQAVETTLAGYRRAWLNNDKSAVMEMISDDVVLFVPGATVSDVVGKANLGSFWFPTTDTLFVITKYEITDQEIHGSGVYAIAQGRSFLSWDTVWRDSVLSSSSSASEYLSVLRKEKGQWRIFRQMYVLRK